jgi:phospholipid/cholesterol/gamma-HCH transport system ATP-binding protein
MNDHSNLVAEFRNVYKAFGKQMVCQGVNLPIRRGKVLSILGPSGCGKTVSIKMLIGLEFPDNGSVIFDNLDLASFQHEDQFLPIRKRIAMVFQGSALFDSMNVFDNVAYPLRVESTIAEDEVEERVNLTLSMVGLPGSRDKMPSELSGGMKKRIGLARAIVTNPEVILYDEPTAGLDPINTRRIVDLILTLQDHLSCTSIVIAHDMHVVEVISNDIAFMYNGKIRQMGSFLDLYNSEDMLVRGFVKGDPNLLLTIQGSL